MTQADAYCDWVHEDYTHTEPNGPYSIARYANILVYTFQDGSWWIRRDLGSANPHDPSGLACESLGTFAASDPIAAALAVAWNTADTEWDEFEIAALFGLEVCDSHKIMDAVSRRYQACYELGAARRSMPSVRLHPSNRRTLGHEFLRTFHPVGKVFPTDPL